MPILQPIAFQPTEQQWTEVVRNIYDAFGSAEPIKEDPLTDQARPHNRRIGVSIDNTIVAGGFSYKKQMAVPPKPQQDAQAIPVAALAGVGVAPPYQGKGALSAMMLEHLRGAQRLGDVASVLMASESGLYPRFGYAVATEMAQWYLRTREFSLLVDSEPVGSFELLHSRDDMYQRLSPLHRSDCQCQHGELLRNELWWKLILEPEKPDWIAYGAKCFVVVSVDPSGADDGYAIYQYVDDNSPVFHHGRVDSKVVIRELCASSANTELNLIRYLSRLPFCRELIWELAPVQPAVPHFMRDRRQFWQHSRLDMMWLRPLDFARLIVARGYSVDGELDVSYSDELLPENSGAYRIRVVAGVASCEALAETASNRVGLSPATLGAIYLGTTRVTELARHGLIQGSDSALRTLDQMFITDRPAFNKSRF